MLRSSRFSVLAVVACAALVVGAAVRPAGSRAAAGSAPALYNTAQASAGSSLYAAKCATCHGAQLEGGAGPALSGPNMTTLGTKTHLTVGEFFDYMTSNMPMNAPASLTHDEYVAVLAYILKENGYKPGPKKLTYAGATGSKVLVRSYK